MEVEPLAIPVADPVKVAVPTDVLLMYMVAVLLPAGITTLLAPVAQVELLKNEELEPLRLTVTEEVAFTELSLASKIFTLTALQEIVVPVAGAAKPIFAGVLMATVIFRLALPNAGVAGEVNVATKVADPGVVCR